MRGYTRRDVLKMGALLAAGAGLPGEQSTAVAAGLDKILSGQAKVIWLQGMSCSGCSISFLNADEPGPLQILTEIISLVYHPNVSAAQGEVAIDTIEKLTERIGALKADIQEQDAENRALSSKNSKLSKRNQELDKQVAEQARGTIGTPEEDLSSRHRIPIADPTGGREAAGCEGIRATGDSDYAPPRP